MTGTNGKPLNRDIVRHPGAVAIVPVLETPGGNQIVLIKNWRISVEQWVYEIPAGTLEKDEAPADCAARELEEETGYSAATITPLCRFYTSPGLSDELMWVFLATGLKPVGQRLEVDERVTVHPTGMNQAFSMIESGFLVDAKSIAALLLARSRGFLGS